MPNSPYSILERIGSAIEMKKRISLSIIAPPLLLFLLIAKRSVLDDFYRGFNTLLSNALHFAIEFSMHWVF